ncbi:Ataxin-3 [Monoraphidium neglectum]|uniref:ubiquitinyl hydrolase 1 n=1 Tax=Monoraphidium neglectum TaxID=145388 RepID=A0A0D2MQR5_9CHLO|nr:Ataxin-3 [Monoraphidium neglectum]KIY96965.1 Ataxin-3 [Monoraphidium neglectum]|eukprot:XP_013895985.1 Ataxin-3 [Monoraphidium neglectum]
MWLYHEKQVIQAAGLPPALVAALCGVHCVNALLQGHYFSELDLAAIAQELDRLEAEVLGGEGLGEGEHGNLDDSGMFSSQVLSKALELWQLQIVPYKSQAIREQAGFDPVNEEHWYTLRRVEGAWWNLNSLLPAPEPLSDFYLAAYLDSLVDQGYSIFVVRGKLPAPQLPPEAGEAAGGAGRWLTPEEARQATKDAATTRQRGKAHNAIETALSRAAQQGGTLTLQPRKRAADAMLGGAGGEGGSGGADEDPELAAALAASLADHMAASQGGASGSGGTGRRGSGSQGFNGDGGLAVGVGVGGGAGAGSLGRGGSGGVEDDEDYDLAAALAASMEDQQAHGGGGGDGTDGAGTAAAAAAVEGAPSQSAAGAAEPVVAVPDEPEEGAVGVLTIALRLHDRVVTRRWRATDTVDQLRAFAALQLGATAPRGGLAGGGGSQVALSTQFPRRTLEDGAAALGDAGVEDRSLLNVST